jgi:hypothetical protein
MYNNTPFVRNGPARSCPCDAVGCFASTPSVEYSEAAGEKWVWCGELPCQRHFHNLLLPACVAWRERVADCSRWVVREGGMDSPRRFLADRDLGQTARLTSGRARLPVHLGNPNRAPGRIELEEVLDAIGDGNGLHIRRGPAGRDGLVVMSMIAARSDSAAMRMCRSVMFSSDIGYGVQGRGKSLRWGILQHR